MNHDTVYLGDAVYADLELGMIKLTANLGSPGEEQVIYLEPSVYAALTRYAAHVWPEVHGGDS